MDMTMREMESNGFVEAFGPMQVFLLLMAKSFAAQPAADSEISRPFSTIKLWRFFHSSLPPFH